VIRALVVDDEAPARSELRYLLDAYEGMSVVGEAATAEDALELVRSVECDVVFLDVEMPGLTGIDAARLVRERRDPPAVVFVTAHGEYAVDAFAVEAFDYLLKPIDPERVARVVARLHERSVEDAGPVEKIPVATVRGTELLEYDQIHYVEADGDHSRVHTYDQSYFCAASLHELEERLVPRRFARVHRSYLVNLSKVAGIRRTAPDRFRLRLADASHTELDVARRQSRVLRERLGL
jgi:two-component system, LytTR family, response regulator LytT